MIFYIFSNPLFKNLNWRYSYFYGCNYTIFFIMYNNVLFFIFLCTHVGFNSSFKFYKYSFSTINSNLWHWFFLKNYAELVSKFPMYEFKHLVIPFCAVMMQYLRALCYKMGCANLVPAKFLPTWRTFVTKKICYRFLIEKLK